MACFTLDWVVQLLILAIVVAVVVGIVNIVLSKIPLPEPWPSAVQVARLVMWGVIAVFLVYLLASLISCAFGGGPLFPRMGRG